MSRRLRTSWTVTLEGRLPNSMNIRERQSHWQRKKELDEITDELRAAARAEGVSAARGRRFVIVTIHKSKRSRVKDDPANLPSRAKAVLDALVRCELLLDDNETHLMWGGVVEGEKRDEPATVIHIREVARAVAS